jgi:hypothetical protein
MKKVNILKFTAIWLSLTMSFVSCKEEKDYDTIPFVIIGGGDEGRREKQELIINTQDEWDNLLLSLPKHETMYFSETEIDFGSYMVIGVFDETRPDPNWSIGISQIREYFDKVVIIVNIRASQGPALSVLSNPYGIAKIPIISKDIQFQYINK